MSKINQIINDLIAHGKQNLGVNLEDNRDAKNTLLNILSLENITINSNYKTDKPLDAILEELISFCVANKVIDIEESETFVDKVMSLFTLPPDDIDLKFKDILVNEGSKKATTWFYKYCIDNAYIKKAKLDKNPRFNANGLIITINKAKPEFRDMKKAASANNLSGDDENQPKCVICRENVGYGPRNKRTLRTVSLKLHDEDFFWQYSPYGYFKEHGIAVNNKHIPMFIDKSTLEKLLDFVDLFPHYFIGCNAPLPRIGGSVLAHDHFQGGGEVLPLHTAKCVYQLEDPFYPSVEIGVLDWPGTVIRLTSKNRSEIVEVAEKIRKAWINYNNENLGIIAEDKDGIHNAISPTVIKKKDVYEMNIILRSNITSEKYPDGVFHAHPEFHSIKKESIGLIEAQGLFILPGRLEEELNRVEECIAKGILTDDLSQFKLIFDEIRLSNKKDIHQAMKDELGNICYRILENTAVFKSPIQTAAFLKELGFYG